jgi:hypothetical protein
LMGFWIYRELDSTAILMEGRGLYAALDPFSSRYFGNTLLEITIKKGSKVLLQGQGIFSLYWAATANNSQLQENQELEDRVKRSVIHKLAVVGFTYEYDNGINTFCSKHQDVAFLLSGTLNSQIRSIDSSAFDVIGLVPRKSRENDEARGTYKRIGSLYQYLKQTDLLHRSDLRPQTRPFDGGNYRESNVDELKQIRPSTFSCGVYPEDYPRGVAQ